MKNREGGQFAIYHNIRWPKYKAAIFSALYALARNSGTIVRFVQVADTSSGRISLGEPDLSYHQYPHKLLFAGNYDSVPTHRLALELVRDVLNSKARLVVLPGYDRVEYWAMMVAARLTGKSVAVFCDSTLSDRPQGALKGVLKRFFFKRCQGFFAYGIRSVQLLEKYGAPSHAIYFPCQAAALAKDYSSTQARMDRLRCLASPTAPRFLYVGRLSPEKSIEILFEALVAVRAQLPGSRLVLVGAGPCADELRNLAKSLKVENAIEFIGSLGPTDLAFEYAKATCLILPSNSEAWGLVVNEALHYGCPAIVSHKCGCVPELIIDGITGYQFRAGDPLDLSIKMRRLVAEFTDAEVVTENCIRTMEKYTPARAAARIMEGCLKILEKCKSAR